MINPQGFGINPQLMAQAHQVGEYVEARFVIDRAQGKFILELVPRRSDAEMAAVGMDLGRLLDGLVEALGTQLYTYFGMGGKIQDVE
jgi:hypothetical protein